MDDVLGPAKGAEFLLLFDKLNSRHIRFVAAVYAVDAWNQVEFAAITGDGKAAGVPGWPKTKGATFRQAKGLEGRLCLVTRQKELLTGYLLLVRLARALPLLWPLAILTFVPGVSALGRTRRGDSSLSLDQLEPDDPALKAARASGFC